MSRNLSLLSQLEPDVLEWILEAGTEQSLAEGDTLLREGEAPGALYVVLSGLLGVELSSVDPSPLALLGPGELLGEMSLVEDGPASASVVAREACGVLACPRETLAAKLERDDAFAARFYRGVARVAGARLRERVNVLSRIGAAAGATEHAPHPAWARIEKTLDAFRESVTRAEREVRAGGTAPGEAEQAVLSSFDAIVTVLEEVLGSRSPIAPALREELGLRVRSILLPYILLTELGGRAYTKPRGYAGDYLTIQTCYDNEPRGHGPVGAILDHCCLELPSMRAVRNRRGLVGAQILHAIEAAPETPARVTSLACGPAAELFDVFSGLEDTSRLSTTLLDIDYEALAFVSNRRDAQRLRRQMNLVPANLVHLATGRQTLDIPPQDLVYSIGLIDYFDDPFVIRLLDWIHEQLRPGGRVMLGNFHVDNPCAAAQGIIWDWELIHRSEEDMHRLFRTSRFGVGCSEILYEDEGINLFAIAEKG